MVMPQVAAVKPRVLDENGSDLLLETEILQLIEQEVRGYVAVLGPAGAGKSTALAHLSAVLPKVDHLVLLDSGESVSQLALRHRSDRLIVSASAPPKKLPPRKLFRLAPWNRDDVIEYTLARHRDRCASIMKRIRWDCADSKHGIPELWALLIDQLAADESIPNLQAALHRFLTTNLPVPEDLDRIQWACSNLFLDPASEKSDKVANRLRSVPAHVARILRHQFVLQLLTVERMVASLNNGATCKFLKYRLPRELIRDVAQRLTPCSPGVDRLRQFVGQKRQVQAMAASILHAVGAEWSLPPAEDMNLRGAYLPRVDWPGAQLINADVSQANLFSANLTGAHLDGAIAIKAMLRQTCLRDASINGICAQGADMSAADLARAKAANARFDGANLTDANLAEANLANSSFRFTNLSSASFNHACLRSATFFRVKLENTDFSEADFENANLCQADFRRCVCRSACFTLGNLKGCNFEDLDLGEASFQKANLKQCLLTGTRMRNASLDDACLQGAGLGEIDWEDCSLRNVDLTGAIFHMGSTRSGMLFTNVASEGTRTGFYTDDYDDRAYRPPEEIRKANLCGCDLRGAKVEYVDFYLVDLRDARYDRTQEDHFRRCGALLGQRE
jgi:uncharacterized protein YjbI with pentapeptide repeats/energy-coupling factor transporter ATP-binding protein EcfA2